MTNFARFTLIVALGQYTHRMTLSECGLSAVLGDHRLGESLHLLVLRAELE